MIVCIPVTPSGEIDHSWGRAPRVGLAQVRDGGLAGWEEVAVGWDELHDAGTEGGHHARIARFLQEHGVEVVVAHHMGDPMVRMLQSMGIELHLGAGGDARQAALRAVGN